MLLPMRNHALAGAKFSFIPYGMSPKEFYVVSSTGWLPDSPTYAVGSWMAPMSSSSGCGSPPPSASPGGRQGRLAAAKPSRAGLAASRPRRTQRSLFPGRIAGLRQARIADCSPFSRVTERKLTVFTRHPEVASPTRRRLTACVAESLSSTTLVAGLRMVPINFTAGRSGGAAAAGACAGSALASMAAVGGRREREKSGRSRVAVRALSGIFESGAPASVASLRLDEGVARSRSSIGAADAGAARARPKRRRPKRRMCLTNMGAAALSPGAVRATPGRIYLTNRGAASLSAPHAKRCVIRRQIPLPSLAWSLRNSP